MKTRSPSPGSGSRATPGFWEDSLPLLRVEDGEDVFVGHEPLLHIPDFQIIQRQHVLLLLLLEKGTRGDKG